MAAGAGLSAVPGSIPHWFVWFTLLSRRHRRTGGSSDRLETYPGLCGASRLRRSCIGNVVDTLVPPPARGRSRGLNRYLAHVPYGQHRVWLCGLQLGVSPTGTALYALRAPSLWSRPLRGNDR